MHEVERELRSALERMPAPPGLKRKLMQRRDALHAQRRRRLVRWWQRLTVAATLAALVVCAMLWRSAQQRRKAEQVRREVMAALRSGRCTRGRLFRLRSLPRNPK